MEEREVEKKRVQIEGSSKERRKILKRSLKLEKKTERSSKGIKFKRKKFLQEKGNFGSKEALKK